MDECDYQNLLVEQLKDFLQETIQVSCREQDQQRQIEEKGEEASVQEEHKKNYRERK